MPGKFSAKGGDVGAGGYAAWRQSLSRLAGALVEESPKAARRLQDLLERLDDPGVTVTFAGHFKAGKSTLLNAALRRPLLPTRDLPETGARCVIRRGTDDSAEVVESGKRRAIPCTCEALREVISVRSSTGGRNKRLDEVDHVDICLRGFPAGAAVRWIDSPGISDRPELTRRALDAALEADVVVWVMRSDQFLSEAEARWLADFLAARGPAALALVINAFLPTDTPEEWKAFLADKLPVHRAKLVQCWSELRQAREALPSLIPVSGRALEAQGEGFGGRELRRLLLTHLSGPQQPRVRRARLGRAAVELGELAEQLAPEFERLREANEEAARSAGERAKTIAAQKANYLAAAEAALETFFATWEKEARRCGAEVAAPIAAGNLQRDTSYGDRLTAKLQAAAAAALDTLLGRLETAARRGHRSMPNETKKAALRRLLTPGRVTVTVPNGGLSWGRLLGPAATGGALGGPVGFLGGLIAGVAWAAKHSVDEDVAGTKANITGATQAAVAALKGKRDEALALVRADAEAGRDAVALPDRSQERRLGTLVERLRGAAREAVELARGEDAS